MSSQRQQCCGCSRHVTQLTASTCRSWSWLYGVVFSDGTLAVPPLCFLLYVLYSFIMRGWGGWGDGLAQAHWVVHFKVVLWEEFTCLNCPFFYFSFCSFSQMNIRFGRGPDWSRSLKNNCSQSSQHAALQLEKNQTQQDFLVWIRRAVVDFQLGCWPVLRSHAPNQTKVTDD